MVQSAPFGGPPQDPFAAPPQTNQSPPPPAAPAPLSDPFLTEPASQPPAPPSQYGTPPPAPTPPFAAMPQPPSAPAGGDPQNEKVQVALDCYVAIETNKSIGLCQSYPPPQKGAPNAPRIVWIAKSQLEAIHYVENLNPAYICVGYKIKGLTIPRWMAEADNLPIVGG